MIYSYLGSTKLQVSKICLGTMTFGEQNSETEGHEQLNYAIDNGINFIDTAEMYSIPGKMETQGSTEKIIGTWLKKRKDRDRLVLASKIVGPTTMTWIREDASFSEEHILQAVNNSLKRLQTDYIDLYQLHWPERKMNMFGVRGFKPDENDRWKDNINAVLHVFNRLIKEGKIRYLGLSNENAWGVFRFLNEAEKYNLPRVVSIQNPYNLLNRTYEIALSEISYREQCGLLAYSPLAFGWLTGKYHNGTADATSRVNKFTGYKRYSNQNCYNAIIAYQNVAKKYGVSLTTLALSYVNEQKFLTSNIIGATKMDQLKENINSIHFNLTPEMRNDIEEVYKLFPDPAC